MPFVPVQNVMQTNVRYTLHGEQVENTLYWFAELGVSPSVLQLAAENLLQEWRDNIMTQLSVDLQLREVYAFDLSSSTGSVYTATGTGGPFPGGLNDPALPGNVAACLSFRTANRGRSFRGRIYLPGLTEPSVIGNNLNGIRAAGITAGFAVVSTVMASLGLAHVVVSRVSNGVPRTTGVATGVSSILFTDTSVDSQRRRLGGRGN